MRKRENSLYGICENFFPKALMMVFLILVLSAGWGEAAPGVHRNYADRDRIMDRIHQKGSAKIIVQFESPEIKMALGKIASLRSDAMGSPSSADSSAADFSLAHHIGSTSRAIIAKLGGTRHEITHTFSYLPGLALEVSAETLDMLESMEEVTGIFENKRFGLPPVSKTGNPDKVSTLAGADEQLSNPLIYPQNPDTIGMQAAWSLGYTGSGWYVAVLDTGTRRTHELFAGKSIVEACFSSNRDCPNGQTSMFGAGSSAPYDSSYDGYEHGTHVAGIAVGKSGASFGVARDASLISIQVFSRFDADDCDGTSPCVQTYSADQLYALDYLYSVRNTYKIAAVNMSLGSSLYSSESLCNSENSLKKLAIDNLRSAGIATVIAAGNDETCGTIEAPACISSAIAVGAVNDNDREVRFNDWHYSMLDLLAPGDSIYSATPDSDTSYENLNGTSMSTPHVAGAWAIMKQQNPAASVSDIYYALASTGKPVQTVCVNINDIKPRIQIDAALANPAIPVPTTRGNWVSYNPTASPVLNFTKAFVPLGIGPAAGTNPVLNLRIGFARFAGPVDIYFGFQSNAVDPNTVFVLRPDNVFQNANADGLVPWKSSVTGAFDQSLFGELSLLDLPPGVYNLYIAVSPASNFDSYYLWNTYFVR